MTLPQDLDFGELRLSRVLVLMQRKFQRYLTEVLRRNGVGLSEYPILLVLYHAKELGVGELSQTEIATINVQDKALVTRAVRKLENDGLVKLSLDPSNKARHLVSVTDLGYAKGADIDAAITKWEDKLWEAIGPENRDAVMAVEKRLKEDFIAS